MSGPRIFLKTSPAREPHEAGDMCRTEDSSDPDGAVLLRDKGASSQMCCEFLVVRKLGHSDVIQFPEHSPDP